MNSKADIQTREKQLAAKKAIEFVESGMVVGLGTGSTVKFMVEDLAKKVKDGLDIVTVSTSIATTRLAKSLQIKVLELKDVKEIDLAIDGADEVDPNLNGIKGGGGALLYEKIIASSSKKNIWMVDSSKVVKQLGKFPLPVEVVPFGAEKTFDKLVALSCRPEFRYKGSETFVTDGGHYIIDLNLNEIDNSRTLNDQLILIPGVVETGLFINICDILIVGKNMTCEVITKNEKDRLN